MPRLTPGLFPRVVHIHTMTTTTRTRYIDYTKAQTLRQALHAWSDSHSVTAYNDLVPAIHQAGLTTCLIPYTSSPKAKKLELYLAICPFEDFEGNSESKFEARPTHYYTMLHVAPMTVYMQELWSINLKEPWYSVDWSHNSLRFLLSKPQEYSAKSGRGFAHRENLMFFDMQFNADWPEGTDKIIEPPHKFDERRYRWSPVAFNPNWNN